MRRCSSTGVQSNGTCFSVHQKVHISLSSPTGDTIIRVSVFIQSSLSILCVLQRVFQNNGSCGVRVHILQLLSTLGGHCHVITAEHVLQHEYITATTLQHPLTARHTLRDAALATTDKPTCLSPILFMRNFEPLSIVLRPVSDSQAQWRCDTSPGGKRVNYSSFF